jgi:hypothetical protein
LLGLGGVSGQNRRAVVDAFSVEVLDVQDPYRLAATALGGAVALVGVVAPLPDRRRALLAAVGLGWVALALWLAACGAPASDVLVQAVR